MSAVRRVVSLVCIALVVVTAIVGGAASHFSDVLEPLWLVLFPVLPFVGVLRNHDDRGVQPVALRSLLASRAPPLLLHA